MKNLDEFDFTQIFAKERIGFLSTIDKISGDIQLNAVSWIYAYQPKILRIAVSTKSQIVKNVETHGQVNFSFFYEKAILSFQSKSKIITKEMSGVPFPLTIIEIEAVELHDIMFYGSEIIQEPIFQKTYKIEVAKKLDEQVYQSMALNYVNVEATDHF